MAVRRNVMVLGCGLLLAVLAACVSDQASRQRPRAPQDLSVRTVTIAAHNLLDEDLNGYFDTIPLVVYLWDLPSRYPLPIWADGAMRFLLKDEHDRVIAEWDVPAEVVAASRRRDQVGPVHLLTLDIREATTDALPPTTGLLTVDFVSQDGEVASSARPLAIKLGA